MSLFPSKQYYLKLLFIGEWSIVQTTEIMCTRDALSLEPSAERFIFVRREAMSKVQKRYSLPKSNRNAPLNPDFGL